MRFMYVAHDEEVGSERKRYRSKYFKSSNTKPVTAYLFDAKIKSYD